MIMIESEAYPGQKDGSYKFFDCHISANAGKLLSGNTSKDTEYKTTQLIRMRIIRLLSFFLSLSLSLSLSRR